MLSARLGLTLYVPIGLDWMTEGYWAFGQNQPGLTADLAQQYLVPHAGVWEEDTGGADWSLPQYIPGGLYVTYDPEFPDEPIQGVTLAAARRLDWSHIMPTLDDNQHGFARFAREVGAQYVYQVGNTNQWVDWTLDPLALISAEAPIVGRGVRHHQEMDPEVRFREPAAWTRKGHAPSSIRSFVNCFPSIACAPLLARARSLLPEFTVAIHGIDGPDGVVKPIARLADEMARAGWGWHDKEQGDGFGHVLHMWAAIGRPIVGHGFHYAGKMGEVFWRHGETCIDLDRVDVDEAAGMIRSITADGPRWVEMGRAIRAVYDANVNIEAETEAIRVLLGMP